MTEDMDHCGNHGPHDRFDGHYEYALTCGPSIIANRAG